jgi:hypothetical protein
VPATLGLARRRPLARPGGGSPASADLHLRKALGKMGPG